jgi:Ni,Fe-hydrogenase III small subunit
VFDAPPVATLLENHRAFLRCLERRVGVRALAEDILQDAFAKVVARVEQAPADEAILPCGTTPTPLLQGLARAKHTDSGVIRGQSFRSQAL